MNVDLLKENNHSNDAIINAVNSIKTFAFELELPEAASFRELLASIDDTTGLSDIPSNNSGKISPDIVKKLKYLAIKDNIPFKMKNIKDIRLLIYAHDMLNNGRIFKIDMDSMNNKDIDFLKQFMDNPNAVINNFNSQSLQVNVSFSDQSEQVSYKSFNISKGLSDLIEYAYRSQKPVRLDFDNNSSIILKINNEGKLSAEFMSSNKAMEHILKNSLPHLRNRLDSEGIPYKEIIYKERNKRHNSEEQERS